MSTIFLSQKEAQSSANNCVKLLNQTMTGYHELLGLTGAFLFTFYENEGIPTHIVSELPIVVGRALAYNDDDISTSNSNYFAAHKDATKKPSSHDKHLIPALTKQLSLMWLAWRATMDAFERLIAAADFLEPILFPLRIVRRCLCLDDWGRWRDMTEAWKVKGKKEALLAALLKTNVSIVAIVKVRLGIPTDGSRDAEVDAEGGVGEEVEGDISRGGGRDVRTDRNSTGAVRPGENDVADGLPGTHRYQES